MPHKKSQRLSIVLSIFHLTIKITTEYIRVNTISYCVYLIYIDIKMTIHFWNMVIVLQFVMYDWANSGQFHFGINHKHTSRIWEPRVNKNIVSSPLYPSYVCGKPILAIERGSFFDKYFTQCFCLQKDITDEEDKK